MNLWKMFGSSNLEKTLIEVMEFRSAALLKRSKQSLRIAIAPRLATIQPSSFKNTLRGRYWLRRESSTYAAMVSSAPSMVYKKGTSIMMGTSGHHAKSIIRTTWITNLFIWQTMLYRRGVMIMENLKMGTNCLLKNFRNTLTRILRAWTLTSIEICFHK